MVKISKPFVTHADESLAYWQIGNLWQVIATGVLTDNAFTLLDQVVHNGGGGGPTTHTHIQDEGLYVIPGKCTFNAGGHQGLQGTPGTFVSIPGNTEHSFTVDLPNTHVLNFYLPAGFEQILIEVSHPAIERAIPNPSLIKEMLLPRWLADKLSDDYGTENLFGVNTFVDGPDENKMLTKPTPSATLFPFLANAKDLTHYNTMGGNWTILASGLQTGGCYCLLEVLFRKGIVVAPRVYNDRDEMLYVFEGSIDVLLDDRTVYAKKGAWVHIPSGTVYSFKVESDEARCLNLHTRSGFEELIQLAGDGEENVDRGVRERLLVKIGLKELAVMVLST